MKRTTIADIARKLQVSLHTVNKALYGKKGVGDELRAKILQTAEEMNYRVNRVAQSMARKTLVIGVIHHASAWRMITEQFMAGIKSAIEQFQDYNVEGRYYTYSSPEERFEAFHRAISQGVSVTICLHFVPNAEEVNQLANANIPFALLGTDGLEQQRLTCVRADSLMSGRLAAEFISIILPAEAPVAIFTGSRNYRDHADKVTGFIDEMSRHGRRICELYEHEDQPDLAAAMTEEAFRKHPDLAGIYSSTGNSVAICRAIVKCGHHPLLVTTDLYDEIKVFLRDNIITSSIYQDAPGQGRKLVELLYAALCENQMIPGQVFIPPTMIFRANINIF